MGQDKRHLNDVAKATLVQKDELLKSEDKLTEVRLKTKEVDENLEENKLALKDMDDMLDKALLDMQNLLSQVDVSKLSDEEIQAESLKIEQKLSNLEVSDVKQIQKIDKLEDVKFDGTWEEYISSVNQYIEANNLLTSDDPFKDLMSDTQRLELQKRIKDEFSYKNAKCDEYDYMIAGTCGILSGLIDVFFVGKPNLSKAGEENNSFLGKQTDKLMDWVVSKRGLSKKYNDSYEEYLKHNDNPVSFKEFINNQITEQYEDHKKNKEKNGGKPLDFKNFRKSEAVKFLEKNYKVNYDQTDLSQFKNLSIDNLNGQKLSAQNHHLLSLGHNPDLIGLFFSILNQFNNTSSFISNGKIFTFNTETFELQGNDFISKIICGFWNWLYHILSDIAGSKSSVKKGNRGSGLPIPFYELFQFCDFGEFGKDKKTLAMISTKVFEQGYDFRHGLAMAIPVVINELLIRFMYVIKARYYHKKDWKDCMPSANIPELRRMLLVGHGALCLVDGIDAGLRSGGDPVQFLLRTNLIGWVRFGHLSLKELHAWIKSGKMDIEKVDEYLDNEFKTMLKTN